MFTEKINMFIDFLYDANCKESASSFMKLIQSDIMSLALKTCFVPQFVELSGTLVPCSDS